MTTDIDKRIIRFIKQHHVFTLATTSMNQPWCANCFYAFIEDEAVLVFTSDDDTRHILEATTNPEVAGSIVLETKIVGKIRGLQFTGILSAPDDELAGRAKAAYLLRFPYAALMKTTIWVLHLNYLKFTDNRLGFGKKLYWRKV